MTYMHGRPDAPAGFNHAMSGTTHLFTWDNAIPMAPNAGGVISYWLRWTDGDPTLAATKWTKHGKASDPGITGDFYKLSPTQTTALKDGEMYTFELTAAGTSSSTTKVLTSAAASQIVPIGTPGTPVTPVPAPTLSEYGALLLGLMLIGGGGYLLRRRQSSGLISA